MPVLRRVSEALAQEENPWARRGEAITTYMEFMMFKLLLMLIAFFSASLISMEEARVLPDIFYFKYDAASKTHKPDLYADLQLPKNASQIEIRKAYRRLTLLWHPDKHHYSPNNEAILELYKRINYAYEVLSNELKLTSYLVQRTVYLEPIRTRLYVVWCLKQLKFHSADEKLFSILPSEIYRLIAKMASGK